MGDILGRGAGAPRVRASRQRKRQFSRAVDRVMIRRCGNNRYERARPRRAAWWPFGTDAFTDSLVDEAARDWLHFCSARRSVPARSFWTPSWDAAVTISLTWTRWQAFQLAWLQVFLDFWGDAV